jgi:hypothetical protein
MTTKQIKNLIKILTDKGVHFEVGLTDDEVLQVETKFNIKFPPDLKLFLKTALPTSQKFVNWRAGLKSKEEANKIVSILNWPLEGMLFDVKNNYWLEDWGQSPENYDEKEIVVKKNYETYPKLIPINSHRYIPSVPNESGNPIFSIYQLDIIYYGTNLEHYFANEFRYTKSGSYELENYPEKKIEFWSKRAEDEDVYN